MLLSLGIVPLGGWSSGKYGALCCSSVLSVLCGTLLYGANNNMERYVIVKFYRYCVGVVHSCKVPGRSG